MIKASFTFLTLCLATVFAILINPGTGAAQSATDKLVLEYDFIGGGVRVLEATFNLKFNRKTYQANTRLKTRGIANLFSKSTSYYNARGGFYRAQVRPREFQVRTKSRKGQKTARIVWKSRNKQKINAVPALNTFRQASIDKVLKPAFPDPLSALVAITFSTSKLCQNKIRSFDGRKVFDFKLQYIGKVTLHKGEAGSYFGPAHKCRFSNVPIAGYSKMKMKKYHANTPAAYTIWFAPIKTTVTRKTIYVPVKASGSLNWASVSAVITKGSLNGKPLTIR